MGIFPLEVRMGNKYISNTNFMPRFLDMSWVSNRRKGSVPALKEIIIL